MIIPPDRAFSAACSHSGATTFTHCPLPHAPDIQAIADNLSADGRYDLFRLARKFVKPPQKPALRFDCGQDDFLLKANRLFHAHLKKLEIKHVYREYHGGHTWKYWDLHVRESIEFILTNLKFKRNQESI